MKSGISPNSRLTEDVIARCCKSLRVNPSWSAAADYAGIAVNTLRNWRRWSELYEPREDDDEETAQLDERRLYRAAREAWRAGQRQVGMALFAELDELTERRDGRVYWIAVQRMNAARADGELELVALVRKAASRDWRAAWALLRSAWPERYGDEAGELPAAMSLVDVESRARAALEEWERRQAQGE
jgi:hypothetical protein